MRRRTYLKTVMASAAAARPMTAQLHAKPIQLHVDLTVDPAKEQQMLSIFHTQFAPAASKQPGFIDAKILKLRTAMQGSAPSGCNYRFVLRFQSEEQRQSWVKTAIHEKLWPTIENTLANKNYTVLLYDQA